MFLAQAVELFMQINMFFKLEKRCEKISTRAETQGQVIPSPERAIMSFLGYFFLVFIEVPAENRTGGVSYYTGCVVTSRPPRHLILQKVHIQQ